MLNVDFSYIPPEKSKINRLNQKPWKGLYRTFVSKNKRQKDFIHADLIHQKYVAECWQKVITLYFEQKLELFHTSAKKEFTHSKIIWQYWGQGIDDSLPETVKICFNSVDKYKEDYTVIRLDDHTLYDYIDLPDFVCEKLNNPHFRRVFFSDVLRVVLLYHYGGIWIDATILLTAPIDENIKQQDFFVFQRDINAQNQLTWQKNDPNYFSWDIKHCVNMLSSFMLAKPLSPLLYDWIQLVLYFWKTQEIIGHYFFFQILFQQLKNSGKYTEVNHLLIIDDTLPHLLISQIHQPFDLKNYMDILAQVNIHKLTYIKESNRGSYYEFIRKEYG